MISVSMQWSTSLSGGNPDGRSSRKRVEYLDTRCCKSDSFPANSSGAEHEAGPSLGTGTTWKTLKPSLAGFFRSKLRNFFIRIDGTFGHFRPASNVCNGIYSPLINTCCVPYSTCGRHAMCHGMPNRTS